MKDEAPYLTDFAMRVGLDERLMNYDMLMLIPGLGRTVVRLRRLNQHNE